MSRETTGRRALAVLLVLAGASGVPLPAGVWDFFGGAGLNLGRTDNPGFAGSRVARPVCATGDLRAVCDPNSPTYDETLDPNSPLYEPTRRVSSSVRRGDVTGSVRLTGGARAQWDRTKFDIAYSPTGSFFVSRSELNQLSHNLNSTWSHNYSQRSSLAFNGYVNYTPEQDIDPNNLQQNSLLVQRTSQTHANLRGVYTIEATRMTGFSFSYGFFTRLFSSPDYVDSRNHHAGMQWRRSLGERHSVTAGYDYGIFSFSDDSSTTSDPNNPVTFDTGSRTHRGSVGYGFQSVRGFTAAVNVGYNILEPEETIFESTSGLYLSSTVGWSADRFGLAGGYSRGFTDGGGAFGNAETNNAYGSYRIQLGRDLSADLAVTRNVHERIILTAAGAETGETVRTVNGRTSLTYAIGKSWGLNASYNHYRQATSSIGSSLPEIRSNRYAVGLTWSFD